MFEECLDTRIGGLGDLLVRRVSVNRSRKPQEALKATGCALSIDRRIVAMMPHGSGESVCVYFFKVNRDISDDDLEKEYEMRGLRPDPYALAAVNEDSPCFAEDHPNGCHWKDFNGKWCNIFFCRFGRMGDIRRRVVVHQHNPKWHESWWFGGVRK